MWAYTVRMQLLADHPSRPPVCFGSNRVAVAVGIPCLHSRLSFSLSQNEKKVKNTIQVFFKYPSYMNCCRYTSVYLMIQAVLFTGAARSVYDTMSSKLKFILSCFLQDLIFVCVCVRVCVSCHPVCLINRMPVFMHFSAKSCGRMRHPGWGVTQTGGKRSTHEFSFFFSIPISEVPRTSWVEFTSGSYIPTARTLLLSVLDVCEQPRATCCSIWGTT